MGQNNRSYAWVGAQEFYPRPAGNKEQVKQTIANRRQRRVGMQGDPIAPSDMNGFGKSGYGDFDASAAQKVDRRDGLQLLKTLG